MMTVFMQGVKTLRDGDEEGHAATGKQQYASSPADDSLPPPLSLRNSYYDASDNNTDLGMFSRGLKSFNASNSDAAKASPAGSIPAAAAAALAVDAAKSATDAASPVPMPSTPTAAGKAGATGNSLTNTVRSWRGKMEKSSSANSSSSVVKGPRFAEGSVAHSSYWHWSRSINVQDSEFKTQSRSPTSVCPGTPEPAAEEGLPKPGPVSARTTKGSRDSLSLETVPELPAAELEAIPAPPPAVTGAHQQSTSVSGPPPKPSRTSYWWSPVKAPSTLERASSTPAAAADATAFVSTPPASPEPAQAAEGKPAAEAGAATTASSLSAWLPTLPALPTLGSLPSLSTAASYLTSPIKTASKYITVVAAAERWGKGEAGVVSHPLVDLAEEEIEWEEEVVVMVAAN